LDAQRVRSLTIRRVRSFRELTGLKPDAGTVVSGQFYNASGHCFVERCSGLTSASGQSRDQRVRSFPARPVCATSASGQSRDQRVRSFPARPVCATSTSGHCFAVSRCATGASGQLDQRVRSVLRDLAVARSARLVSWTSASGQHDFGCLSF
jgi:hypothetical protein